MNTVFVGGSRHVSSLSTDVKDRLNNAIKNGHKIIVGDANGADKAVQKHLLESSYNNVTVFCSGDSYRNNLGHWNTQHVNPPKNVKGFQFYAAKDREMAREANFGLMIWDGKSAGTVLNVLRLVKAGKVAVLINVAERSATNFKSAKHWEDFLSRCSSTLRAALRDRALPGEWLPENSQQQSSFLDALGSPVEKQLDSSSEESAPIKSDDELVAAINSALASSNPNLFVDALGRLAKTRSMTKVANDAGLARESLYRSFRAAGNPEFATVLKVMKSVGLRLTARKINT